MRILGLSRRHRRRDTAEQPSEMLGVIERGPILTLLGANAISQVGNMMVQAVAIPWFVLETTGSPVKTGLTGAALAVGAVVPSVLGGPLVDRMGFKQSSVVADVASAAAMAAIPLLHWAGALEFWQLLLLVFLLASFNAQGDTARLALVPGLAGRAAMPIERANAADRAIARFGQLLGPLLGGLLVALIGASNVLFIDAATFMFSAALVGFGIPTTRRPEQPAAGYRTELLEGVRFLRGDRPLLAMAFLPTVGNFLDVPLVTVVLPVYAMLLFGSATSLGFVVGTFAAGAILGTLLFGAFGTHLPRRVTYLLSFAAAAVLIYGALAARPPLVLVAIAAGLGGLAAGPINPIFLTVMQERTPPQMLGRASGAFNGLVQAGIPFGAALAGFAIEAAGLTQTILTMGSVYLIVIVAMALSSSLRRIDERPFVS